MMDGNDLIAEGVMKDRANLVIRGNVNAKPITVTPAPHLTVPQSHEPQTVVGVRFVTELNEFIDWFNSILGVGGQNG